MVAMSREEEEKPTGRKWRGPVTIVAVVIAILAASTGAALLYREDLAHMVLRDRLEAQGLRSPRFQIDELTTDAFSVTDFSAGKALSFERLTVGYSIDGLLDGRIAHIDLIGLQADLSQPGPWTDLDQTKAEPSGPSFLADPADLPTLNIQQARLRIPGPDGMMNISADATVDPDSAGALTVSATASAEGPHGRTETRYEGTVQLENTKSARSTGRLKVASSNLKTGKWSVKALKIDLPLTIDATADAVSVRFQEKGRIEAASLDIDGDHGTGAVSLSIAGNLTSTATTGRGFETQAEIKLDADRVRAGGASVGKFTGTLPLQIKARPNAVNLHLNDGTRIVFQRLRASDSGPVTDLTTDLSGDIELSWQANTDTGATAIAVEHKLAITPSPVSIRGGPEDIQAALGKILANGNLAYDDTYNGRFTLNNARLTHGARSVSASALKAALKTGPEFARPTARISIGSVRDQSPATVAGAPLSGAYDLAAEFQQTPNGITYEADIGGLGIKRIASISGLHSPEKKSGHADITLPELTLGPSGLQPAAVIPSLAEIKDVVGKVGGKARLIWTQESIGGQATLRLNGVGGKTETGSVDGLSGTLVFDNIWPPTTTSDQELRIEKIDAGAALTETSIRFALLPSGILRINRAEAELAAGKIIVTAPAIDPTAQSAEANVTLQGVELAQLLNLVDLGDLKASGQLHGIVPVRVANGKVAINAGALASLGGGKLQFKSERAQQILKSGGEQVGLMLKALEDFTYERLGVDIDKSLDGNAQVRLRTLGHNPAVLRGRKFQINVNLETNLDRLLDAALEWYRLSGRALRDIVGPRARATGTQKDPLK